MKRFIRYLYEYKQEKRIRNVGFVKVESGDKETIVHMQGKGFHKNGDRKLVLYLFYEENGELIVIRQGEMELKTPVMNWHIKYTPEETGVPENYEKIQGAMIETESGRRIVATWDDQVIDVSRLEEFTEERQRDLLPVVQKESLFVEEQAQEAGDSTTEQADLCPEKDIMEQQTKNKTITKIQRQGLARLPRCEWKLANNQFLIHGYNNYRHLVLINEGNYCKLGVPGIYHTKEAEAAETFGFGEFLPIEEIDISLNAEEKHQDEPFGYWCRLIRTSARRSNM